MHRTAPGTQRAKRHTGVFEKNTPPDNKTGLRISFDITKSGAGLQLQLLGRMAKAQVKGVGFSQTAVCAPCKRPRPRGLRLRPRLPPHLFGMGSIRTRVRTGRGVVSGCILYYLVFSSSGLSVVYGFRVKGGWAPVIQAPRLGPLARGTAARPLCTGALST